jgi:hypothetical protein
MTRLRGGNDWNGRAQCSAGSEVEAIRAMRCRRILGRRGVMVLGRVVRRVLRVRPGVMHLRQHRPRAAARSPAGELVQRLPDGVSEYWRERVQ